MKNIQILFSLFISVAVFAQNEYELDTIYNPVQGAEKNAALIYFGGSEGGMANWNFAQSGLPAMGYPTLAVKYHERKEKPHMVQISIDSIYKMIMHFKARPEIKGKKIVLDGVSKGAELVLLLGSMFPEIDAVIALAPSAVVWEAIDFNEWQDKSTWSYKGKDIPYLPYDREAFQNSEQRVDAYMASLENKDIESAMIKVENIKGPILLFSGQEDKSWPASLMGDIIMKRLKEKEFGYSFEHHSYPDASHGLSVLEDASGTLEGNKKANKHYYQTYLDFLASLNEKISEQKFNNISKEYQDAYINANCEVLMPYLSEDLAIFENGEYWPYEKVKTYCPQLPVKPVLSTDRAYRILNDTLVYEFVSQNYKRDERTTFNETQARIWKFENKKWKIIQMEVSRYPIKTD